VPGLATPAASVTRCPPGHSRCGHRPIRVRFSAHFAETAVGATLVAARTAPAFRAGTSPAPTAQPSTLPFSSRQGAPSRVITIADLHCRGRVGTAGESRAKRPPSWRETLDRTKK
jgi:hypothetical protein